MANALAVVAAVVEVKGAAGGDGHVHVGVCAMDVASVHLIIGQFDDDELSSKLRMHLAGGLTGNTLLMLQRMGKMPLCGEAIAAEGGM